MDTTLCLIDYAFTATSTAGETDSAASARKEAIAALFRGFEAKNAMESIAACQCVIAQFTAADPRRLPGSVLSISRMVLRWMTKFQSLRKASSSRPAKPRKTAQYKEAQPEPGDVSAREASEPPPVAPSVMPRAVSRPVAAVPVWTDQTLNPPNPAKLPRGGVAHRAMLASLGTIVIPPASTWLPNAARAPLGASP